MPLENSLMNVPVLREMLGLQDRRDRQAIQGQAQAMSVLDAAQKLAEIRNAPMRAEMARVQAEKARAELAEAQRLAALRQRLGELASKDPRSPEIQALRAQVDPQGFFKSREGYSLSPGSQRRGPDGELIADNPVARQPGTPLEKYMQLLERTQDPHMRAQIQGAIDKITTRAPGVNVQFGTGVFKGEDEQGNINYYQPPGGKNPDAAPRKITGVRPPEVASNIKALNEQLLTISDYTAAIKGIEEMQQAIQSGNPVGMVGVPGKVARVVEAAEGVVNSAARSDALGLNNKKEFVLGKLKNLTTRRDANFSNEDARRAERSMGMDDWLTNQTAALTALEEQRKDLVNRRKQVYSSIRQGPRAQAPAQAPSASQEVYVDKNGNRAIKLPDGTFKEIP